MTSNLTDPYDPGHSLDCASCSSHSSIHTAPSNPLPDSEAQLDRAIESAVVRSIFGHNDFSRRRFLSAVGAATAAQVIAEFFPLETAKALARERLADLEKTDLTVGFIPITCATPIIMGEPLGFYKKHGLNVTVKRASGWAVIRDWAINKEVDAAHMLSPMPLALTLGAGAKKTPFYMAAVENINGQAITLHVKHKGVTGPADMKGFRFCVPFPYSMHNYLLRYYLAEGGLHPDKDVEIRVVPPPEMVANLKAENVDGYLAPDPFNQRAVYEKVGFIYKLSKELWDGHPCCAFSVSQEFVKSCPNSFLALFKSIIDATHYASKPENRAEIAKAIAPKNYLNQPEILLRQVLSGKYADGLGGIKTDLKRIDFDPYPWHSMAVWILTQMKRWKQIDEDIDYKKVAEQVFLATGYAKVAKELGYEVPESTSKKHIIMGKTFDPDQPEEYLKSFSVKG